MKSINFLIKHSHSPLPNTIQYYNPDGYQLDNIINIANKARVMRFRNLQLNLSQEIINQCIQQFQKNRKLFFQFLTRLLLPIYDHEYPDFKLLDDVILSLELESHIHLEQNTWESAIAGYEPYLLNLIQCLNFSQFQEQLQNLQKILKINNYNILSSQIVIVESDNFWIYNNYYNYESKKKIETTESDSTYISEEKQNEFLNQLQQINNFRELFNMFTNHFKIQIVPEFKEMKQMWICTLRFQQIIINKQSLSKQSALLDASINLLKVIAPIIYYQVLKQSKTDYERLLLNNGRLEFQKKQAPKGLLNFEQFLLETPYDFNKIDIYLNSLTNQQIKSIKKYQNLIIQALVNKYKQLQVQQQILSIGPTFQLKCTISNQTDEKTFQTSSKIYGHGRLIAQAYLISQISRNLNDFNYDNLQQLVSTILT